MLLCALFYLQLKPFDLVPQKQNATHERLLDTVTPYVNMAKLIPRGYISVNVILSAIRTFP